MSAIKNLMLGRVGKNRYVPTSTSYITHQPRKPQANLTSSHPVHPATVHLPLTFLVAACGLDIAQHTFLSFPALAKPLLAIIGSASTAQVSPVIPLVHSMSQLSYLATLAFIITSMPALSTGIFELLALIQARGLEDRVTKVALIHAGLNDVALVGMIYNWLSRRNREAVLSKGSNVLVSASLLLGGLYAAYLGGSLVYSHGVGVQRMGSGLTERHRKGEKAVAPEADTAKGLGYEGEKNALRDSTRETRQKAGDMAQDARAQLDHGIGEARNRAEGLRQGAEQRAGQAAQNVQGQSQYDRKEL